MKNTYYNTTNEQGGQLAMAMFKTEKQEDVILDIMKKYKKLGPSDVLDYYHIITGKFDTPLTSIRRALTNLTASGFLVKTNEKKIGSHKSPEHYWQTFDSFFNLNK